VGDAAGNISWPNFRQQVAFVSFDLEIAADALHRAQPLQVESAAITMGDRKIAANLGQ